MANWQGVKDYIKENYSVREEIDNAITLEIKYTDGRSQLVVIGKHTDKDGNVWAQVYSFIGDIPANMLDAVLEALDMGSCGGLVKVGGKYIIRHCMPVADLQVPELALPIKDIAESADFLEEKISGKDEF